MENQTTALTIVPKQAPQQLVFGHKEPITALEAVGTMAAKSGAFGFNNTQAGAVAVITCIETGITLTEYFRTFHTVEGKPSKKALAALVEFERSGGKFEWLDTGDTATVKPEERRATLRLERGEKKREYSYSFKDAQDEGLVKAGSRWVKRPGSMLRARCITNALPLIAPEIFAGESDDESPAPAPLFPPQQPQPEKAATVQAAVNADVKQAQTEKAAASDGVIDVEATTVRVETPDPSKPATAAETASPSQTSTTPAANSSAPTAAAKPFTSADVRVGTNGQGISAETVQALEAIIGENAQQALDWLKAHKWINTSLQDLNIERARRIIEKPAVFIGYVNGGAK